MTSVELVFDRDCPNVDAARAQLRRALRVVGRAEVWDEHDLSDDPPVHARGYGSPTILVGRRDVVGETPSGRCCRVYPDGAGRLAVVPSVDDIVAALRRGEHASGEDRAASVQADPEPSGTLRSTLEAIPALWKARPSFGVLAVAGLLAAAGCDAPSAQSAIGPDPSFAGCQQACGFNGDYEDSDIVGQHEAEVGDLTTCPVSGAVFRITEASVHVEHEGRRYYVCCAGCATRFREEPARFAAGVTG